MLCFHFDEDDPDRRPAEYLDLEYKLYFRDNKPRQIAFSYRNCSSEYTVKFLLIREGRGLRILACTLS
jgi:hypothetical protein